MAEQDELDTGSEGIPEGETGTDEPPEELIPVYKRKDKPTGKVDQVMWWAFRGKTRKDLEKPSYSYKPGTIRVGFGRLAGLEPGWAETLEGQGTEVGAEEKPGKHLTTAPQKATQIFAKGSPPEAIIESITLPVELDGQAEGFDKGMKFGMSTLVLAVRIMQELSAVAQGQVKPLIDLTRSVREGETAAFKSGADEAAMKAAQAMGNTIMPIMSEMQATVIAATRGSETDPMKSMMVRTMEPLMKNLLGRVVPEVREEPPSGWSKRTE